MNLDAIATRIVSLVMLASILVLTGCQSMPLDSDIDWQVKAFDPNALDSVNTSTVDQMLINELIENYKKHPRDSNYSKLILARILSDEKRERQYFIFDIQGIDDVSVVYVLDSRNIILEKFISSPWVR